MGHMKSKHKGAFNNYVDKIRGEGSKNVCFCPRSGYKNVHTGWGGGSKNGKILSTYLLNDPYCVLNSGWTTFSKTLYALEIA